MREVLLVLLNLMVVAFGYFALAWGGGAIMLWRSGGAIAAGLTAIVVGLACIGHGLWSLAH